MDLADVAGNASDGVHIACAADVWQALVFGFGGVRDFDGRLTIDPHLPQAWESLSFSLRFRGRQLRVALTHDGERYDLDRGDPIEIGIRGERHTLARGEPVELQPTPLAVDGAPQRRPMAGETAAP
jgi:alpha,alpha-trehalose phosphorylase